MAALLKKNKLILILTALWITIGLVFGTQLYLFQSYNGLNPSFLRILYFESSKFFLWIIYIPIVLFLLEKFPLVKAKSRLRSITVHVFAFLFLGFIHMLIFTLFLIAVGQMKISFFAEALLKLTVYSFIYHFFLMRELCQ